MRRFKKWGDELRYRVERVGNDGCGEDEKNAGGVYDMATDITLGIEEFIGREFDDVDGVIELVYNAIKHGKGVMRMIQFNKSKIPFLWRYRVVGEKKYHYKTLKKLAAIVYEDDEPAPKGE